MRPTLGGTPSAPAAETLLCALLIWPAWSQAQVVFPKESPAHIVAAPQTPLEKRCIGRLTEYLRRVLGPAPQVVASLAQAPAGVPVILLASGESPIPLPVRVPDDSPEGFALATAQTDGRWVVAAIGATDRGLKRAIQRLIIESAQTPSGWSVPGLNRAGRPWIPHREWTVCPWTPTRVRGMFVNPWADLRLDITRYGDRQLADYAEMFDWFGYSGCQLMETSYSYGVFGSIEAFQSWQTRLAQAVRSNGQNVSLWVWAAQFSGFGWYDPQVVGLAVPPKDAFEDAATRHVFERYYDHYARLAPLVDRVIGHFYDPGVLADRADVFRYMRLLEQKFKAGNPKVRMGIDFWAAEPDYMQQLLDNGFGDYLLLGNGFPQAYQPGERTKLHEQARQKGLSLGIWGWYLTEYESDQMPSLYVNAHVLKDLYGRIRQEAIDVHPVEYWSEMDAHHLNNIYSMYAAGQLLWDPDRDPDQLLEELVSGIWGPINGPVVLEAVRLIQDVRSGPRWETYWWREPTYRLGTERPGDDLRRADAALAALRRMTPDPDHVPEFPLPFPPETFVELMIPHLRQIRLYSEFRVRLEILRKLAAGGADRQTLQMLLDQAWKPVPEFTTWVGTFGTPELREQDRQLRIICEELQLKLNDPPELRHVEADRVYQVIRSRQLNRGQAYEFPPARINEFRWSEAKLADRVQKLLDDGLLEKTESGALRLKP